MIGSNVSIDQRTKRLKVQISHLSVQPEKVAIFGSAGTLNGQYNIVLYTVWDNPKLTDDLVELERNKYIRVCDIDKVSISDHSITLKPDIFFKSFNNEGDIL